MTVDVSTVEFAVQCLTKGKMSLFKFFVDECSDRSNFVKACEQATTLRKKYFLDILKEVAEVGGGCVTSSHD